jgi:superfamily II DNA/RNA helicase
MPREIRGLADAVLRDPARMELAHTRPAETIAHALYPLAEDDKIAVLERLLAGPDFRSAIVFLRTKRRAKRLAERLDARGHRAVALQGNMSQPQRERALQGFRDGHYDVLVATDIAARGLDIAGVSHVVNFDVPSTPEAYTHRIGRTGRSEQLGSAFTFVTPADAELVRAIEKRLGAQIERLRLAELGNLERVSIGAAKGRRTATQRSGGGARPAHGGPRRPARSRRGFARPAPPPAPERPAPAAPAFGAGVVAGARLPEPAQLERELEARRRRWKRRQA